MLDFPRARIQYEDTMKNGESTKVMTHKFENAGLGMAPFRYVGMTREIYQAIPGDPTCPVQPGTTCDYCSTAISFAFWCVSADGRRFKVGCDCIAKHGDAGLKKLIAKDVRDHNLEVRHARENKKIDAAKELLARDDVKAALSAAPHPYKFVDRTSGRALSLLDWADWMMARAGNTGRIKVLKAIQAVMPAVAA